MATKKKAAPKTAAPAEDTGEGWDQGMVSFVITYLDGSSSTGSQMCWNRGRYIERMQDRARESQKEKKKEDRYTFQAVGG